MSIITTNCWLFTQLIESSNQNKDNDELKVINYLVGNIIKASQVSQKGKSIRQFGFNGMNTPDYVYSTILLPVSEV